MKKLNATANELSRAELVKLKENWNIIDENFNEVAKILPVADDAKGIADEAKGIAETAETVAKDAESKIDGVKSEFNLIVAEAGSNNPEVVQARGGEVNLNARLEKTTALLAEKGQEINTVKTDLTTNYAKKSDVNSLASSKAEKSYVDTNLSALDTKLNSQASGSPKGTYATVAALQTAFPTGNSNVYVVSADGKWYYWNGTAWTAGGTYQSTGIADGGINLSKLDDSLSKLVHYKFDDWEDFGISSTSGNNSDPVAKRIAGMYYANVGDRLVVGNSGYRIQVFVYNLDGVFVKSASYLSNYTFDIECMFRMTLINSSVIDISAENAKTLGSYVTAYFYNQKPVQSKNILNKTIKWKMLDDALVRQYEDDLIFYGAYDGGVSVERQSGNNAVVTFDSSDSRLFYRTKDGNLQINLTTFVYTIPSDYSLVLNKTTKLLEVVSSNSIVRGAHYLLLAARYGKIIKANIKFKEKPDPNTIMPESPRPIEGKYSFSFAVSQDGCVIEDEIWLFHESKSDHQGVSDIYRLDKSTLTEKPIITHNLGHANGVDYKNGMLLVYNGGTFPPEINLYKNPYGKTNLSVNDVNNTQIIFKEGTKTLEGDGSACFGENERVVYYNAGLTIYKILLGMGDNDLSDKTMDKSDMSSWGSFVAGKGSSEYNGTAKVIAIYKASDGLSYAQLQPQGMCFDGFLYLATGYQKCHAYKVQLLNNSTFRVVDDYLFNHSDYKNAPIQMEPQCSFIIGHNLYLGARRTGESFLVKLNL